MTTHVTILAAALLVAAAQAPLSAAQPASGTPGEGASVAVPFDPPLGVPLRYRIEEEREGDGRAARLAYSVSIQFEGFEQGFKLRVTPLETDLPPLPASPATDRITQYLTRPYTLLLSGDGEIVGMENAPDYWSSIIELIDSGMQRPPDSADSQAAARALVAMLRNMPPEVRLALLTRSFAALAEFANVEMRLGQPIDTSIDTPSPLGGTFRQSVNVTLERVAEGRAHFTAEYFVPGEQLEPMIQPLMRQMGRVGEVFLNGNPEMSRRTAQTSEVSLATGLTERYRSTETLLIEVAGQSMRRVTIRTIERVR